MNEGASDILVVDDLPDNLRLLEGVLRGAGYRVRPATGGTLALRAARHRTPDLILLDITMPEMDGFAVCAQLQEDPELRQVPVIFISALDDTAAKVRALDAGGVDYVTKPFEAKEVLARVRAHCALRRARQDLEARNEELERTLAALKRAQVQLVQQEKLASLGVLAAGLAHELNNPINFIAAGSVGLRQVQGGLLQLLAAYESGADAAAIAALRAELDEADPAHALRELTDSIAAGAKRCAGIVEGMRIYAHPGQQDMTLVPLEDSVRSALMLLQNRLRRGIRVDTSFPELPMTLCHPGPMNQVFVNLISNAIDALDSAGTTDPQIDIDARLASEAGRDGIAVSVTDNGPGIDPVDQERIFDPFYTSKPVGAGVGLGLSISHGIVADHQGRIRCESPAAGGTRFTVWIPLPDEETLRGARP